MISKNTELVNLKGSSLTFSAHGWWGKEKEFVAAKNPVHPRKNTAGRGCGGNSAVFLQKIEASPAALLVKAKHYRKILFSLKFFGCARKSKNVKGILLGGERKRAAAGRLPAADR